jgi:hypothetical protein
MFTMSNATKRLKRLCTAQAIVALTSRISSYFLPFPAGAEPQQTLEQAEGHRENQKGYSRMTKKRACAIAGEPA